MCKQAQEDVKRFQLKYKVEQEVVKRDGEIRDRMFSALTEMNKKTKKAKEQNVKPPEDKKPDAAQLKSLYYLQQVVERVALTRLVDLLFKMTQPYFL